MCDGRIGDASFRREVAHGIGQKREFELENRVFGSVVEGSGLHDVEAHNVSFLNQGGECPVSAAGIGGHDEASLVGFVVEERSEGEIGGGIGEDAMGVVLQSGEGVLGGSLGGG